MGCLRVLNGERESREKVCKSSQIVDVMTVPAHVGSTLWSSDRAAIEIRPANRSLVDSAALDGRATRPRCIEMRCDEVGGQSRSRIQSGVKGTEARERLPDAAVGS